MLHEYIKAHKLKEPHGVKTSKFSLVTGQNDKLKTEYAAISMYPTEKVNKLLR